MQGLLRIGSRLVGVLSRDAILRSLEVRRSVGTDQRPTA